MNLAHHLLRTAKSNPSSPAIFDGVDLYCDYATLGQQAASLASLFIEQWKLQPGDRIAICVKNCPQYIPVLYACWWAGMVAVPINAKLHPQEIKFIIENSQSSAGFLDESLWAELKSLWVNDKDQPNPLESKVLTPSSGQIHECQDPAFPIYDATPNHLAWLFYTSGTTGKPKGVMLSHQNIQAMTACYFTDVDEIASSNSSLYAAPMSHGAGFYIAPHILRGAKHVVPKSGGFDPDELLKLAKHHQEISMFAAPTMIKRLIDYIESLNQFPIEEIAGIKTIVYGGGPMYAQDLQKAIALLGQRFVQIYGQGESPMTITSLRKEVIANHDDPRWFERISSVGKPQSLVEVKVVNTDGEPLPPGESGEIIVRGLTVMQGYWNNSAATEQTLKNNWLWTGDLGFIDSEGFLTLKDRSKDLIISGGTNIYPREVEEVLLEHPAISEVSVIGVPDSEWGELVAAILKPSDTRVMTNLVQQQQLEQELDQLCLEKIARFKRPKYYRWLKDLPKNNYGKVLKTELRANWKISQERS